MTKPKMGRLEGALDVTEDGKCPSCGLVPFDEDGPCCAAMWNKDCEPYPQDDYSQHLD